MNLTGDIRYAARGFWRTPAFTLTAVLTLGIGTAGLATVFALLDSLLLRPLPVDRPGELYTVEAIREGGGSMRAFSYPQYELLRKTQGPAGLAAYSAEGFAMVAEGGEPEVHMGYVVTPEYFEVLGLRPAAGRFFAAESQREGEAVVVLSHAYWQTRLGGRPDAIGSTIRISGQPLTVVGVAPQGYHGTMPVLRGAFWVSVHTLPALRPGADIYTAGRMSWLTLVGRVSAATGRAHVEASLLRALHGTGAEFEPSRTRERPVMAVKLAPLRPIPQRAVAPTFGFLSLLMAAALLVLLIAAVNITSMMLARSTARTREMAVRRSLGASRLRLVRQLMTENLMLFLAGAGVGLMIAVWLTSLIPALASNIPVPLHLDVGLDARVAAFAIVAALLAGALFGIAPALHATDPRMMPALRETAGAHRGTRLRSAFIVAQLALSMVLLISGGLLGRALQRALAVDNGFDARNVAVAEIDLAPFGYDVTRSRLFYAQLTARLQARADVEDAASSMMAPLAGASRRWLRPEGHDAAPEDGINYNEVDPGYFSTLRIALLAGRTFTAADRDGTRPVVVVNEAFVRRYWPGENAVGKRVFEGRDTDERAYEVIGVVATTKYRSLAEEPTPLVYTAKLQQGGSFGVIYARSAAGATVALQAMRAEAWTLDPHVPLQLATPLQVLLGVFLAPQRLGALAVGSFGLTGLLLALIGIYGLVAFSAAQRTREIGLRMALGAREPHVMRMFLLQGCRLLAVGSAIGILLALAAARLLTSLLHGVSPTDPVTFLLLPLLLGSAGLVAIYLPARRASRLDPMTVLNTD